MREILVAGNWKMNGSVSASEELVDAEIELSEYSFAEEQGLRWTDEDVDVRGTIIDGVLFGS